MAKDLVAAIYRVSGKGQFATDFGLRDQIRKASVSVMSNIAEGFECGSKREFQRFLLIAKGSSGEVRSQLYIARELGYLDPTEFLEMKTKVEDVSKALSGFICYLCGRK
jgi:four helix bundle protein